MYRFYSDVYGVVDDPSLDSIISWSKRNKTFVIWDPKELIRRNILAEYYCGNMSMLLCILRFYGFKKVKGSRHLKIGHKKYFVRGEPELLEKSQLEAVEKIKKKAKAKAAQGKEAADRFHGLRI